MKKHLTILTGGSRGMGLCMAQQLLKGGGALLSISRQTNDALPPLAEAGGATLLQWQQDLAHGDRVSTRLEHWLNEQVDQHFTSATLINNAGVIGRVGPLSKAHPGDIDHALRVGLEAPMQLTSSFLRATQSWAGVRKVLNISSGLGRRAMASQAGYCAAKAGMDHFTRCVALEEALKPDVLLVHSVYGEPLPKEHGGPVRMITPQLYAWKGAKWIKRIEFLSANKLGFWEERGYSNTAYPWRNDRYS